MLFKEFEYFNHKFPDPQYLGAKHTHLAWIKTHIPYNIKVALDAFGGSQSVSFLFKQMGLKVITNDFLNFNHQIGLGLIENINMVLDPGDIKILFQDSKEKADFTLMEETFSDVFFERSECVFLDNYRANIPQLQGTYKQALAFALINRSMTRKVTMGHFGHTQALRYAIDPERIKRNRNLIRPLKEIFTELVPIYNRAVFDNQKQNKSHNQNILDLLPNLKDTDLVYFDPPYCDSHADYQSFYHLLETYTEYWRDKEFINGIKRYEPQRFSGFDKKRDAVKSFENLFEMAERIPHWLISYNDRSYPEVNDLTRMISKYKDVVVEIKEYQNGRGGKGSVAGSKEVLFVCSPKVKHVVKKRQIETIDAGF